MAEGSEIETAALRRKPHIAPEDSNTAAIAATTDASSGRITIPGSCQAMLRPKADVCQSTAPRTLMAHPPMSAIRRAASVIWQPAP